ncbi:MAG: DUF6599 family protein [Bacteroidales bacterium]
MKHTFIAVLLIIPAFLRAGEPPRDYFPELKGWKKPSAIQTYNPENLWNIIDGAAENYLAYDFRELYMGEYKGKKGSYLTLEIYRHQTPENAFGIFRSEKPSDATPLSLGAEAYIGDDFLNFLSGCFYVKIRSKDASPAIRDAMTTLARLVNDKLGGNNSLPEPLAWFPAENKVPGSETYINSGFLGYSFLNKAFTAEYEVNSSHFSAFLIIMPDEASALEMLKEYLSSLKMDESPETEKSYFLNDKYNGPIALFVKNCCLLGVYNTGDRETSELVLEKLAKNIICR